MMKSPARMVKGRVLLLFILIAFVAGTIAYAADKGKAVGAVVAWKGSVYVKHAGEKKGFRVKSLEGLYAGDVIVTDKRSRAKILLNDDSIINMGDSSKLKINSHSFNLRNRTRTSSIKVLAGKLRTIVTRKFKGKASFFKVRTLNATVGVKGTDFIISTSSSGDEIVAIGGVVTVGSAKSSGVGEVELKAGYGTKVARGRPPTKPERVPNKRLKELIEETEAPVTTTVEMVGLGCTGCHEDVYSEILNKTVPHTVALKSCDKCHLKLVAKGATASFTSDIPAKEGIMFLKVNKKTEYNLTVKGSDEKGEKARAVSKRFIPADVYEEIKNDKKAPVASNFRVDSIGSGIFSSIVFAWETDDYSDTAIAVGPKKTSMTIKRSKDSAYKKVHKLNVDGLRPGDKYYFQTVSTDPFGNTAKSKPVKMKIPKKMKKKKKTKKPVEKPVAGKPVLKDVEVLRVGDKFAARWKSNKPVKVKVELAKLAVSRKVKLSEPHYPGFVTPEYRSIEVCMATGCHASGMHKTMAHPINVQVDIKIARRLKLPLVEDLVTCDTCHDSHGGDAIFMLRKDQTELCLTCHIDGDY